MSSQQANLDTLGGMTGLAHTVFLNKIVKHLAHMAPISGLFRTGRRGADFNFAGTSITWGGDLYQSGGAMATPAGQLPDHQHQDTVQFSTSPTRAYVRRAWDRFVSTLGVTPGTFQDYLPRIMEQATEAWGKMVTRHVHGNSSAVVCLCASRTSDTVIVVKDGYGHADTNPLLYIEKGDILTWHDAGDSFAVKGAAKVLSINYATKAITFAAAFDDGSTLIAADEPTISRRSAHRRRSGSATIWTRTKWRPRTATSRKPRTSAASRCVSSRRASMSPSSWTSLGSSKRTARPWSHRPTTWSRASVPCSTNWRAP
jgi:hypothetical protein